MAEKALHRDGVAVHEDKSVLIAELDKVANSANATDLKELPPMVAATIDPDAVHFVQAPASLPKSTIDRLESGKHMQDRRATSHSPSNSIDIEKVKLHVVDPDLETGPIQLQGESGELLGPVDMTRHLSPPPTAAGGKRKSANKGKHGAAAPVDSLLKVCFYGCYCSHYFFEFVASSVIVTVGFIAFPWLFPRLSYDSFAAQINPPPGTPDHSVLQQH